MDNIAQNIKIKCRNLDNKEFEFPLGTTLLEIYNSICLDLPFSLALAHVNNRAEGLDFQVFRPKIIDFKDISTDTGFRAYIRSLTMVLAKAVHDLYPDDVLRMEHTISSGCYCTLNGRGNKVSVDKILKIKERMSAIIAEDKPILSHEGPMEEVLEIFRQQGDTDTIDLIERLNKPYTRYFSIDDFNDYYFSILLPSTGCLKVFDLVEYNDAMLLRLPLRSNPTILADFEPLPKLFEVLDENARWNSLLGIDNVGDFKKIDNPETTSNLIKVAEALHEKKIAHIADNIVLNNKKIVLIAGPSSSGKTTFSKRLSVQLMTSGIRPVTLSMDNYFVDRQYTPLDEHGEFDYESLYALDLKLFEEQVQSLLKGDRVSVPSFDFQKGEKKYNGTYMQLPENGVLLIEGIHALNPQIVKNIDNKYIYKVYVSALTTISLDNHNWISTTDNRLLRRIIRDVKFRSHSAKDTLKMWASVRRGEDKWIFPYQEEADIMFNSSLIFEFDVLSAHATPILQSVSKDSPEYAEAYRLLKFLQYFKPLDEKRIPSTSLLREFLGGSSFNY